MVGSGSTSATNSSSSGSSGGRGSRGSSRSGSSSPIVKEIVCAMMERDEEYVACTTTATTTTATTATATAMAARLAEVEGRHDDMVSKVLQYNT